VIEAWIANLAKKGAKLTSPVTGEEISHPHLTPNINLKTLIASFRETSC